jgi:zinc and cadmium transporter
VLLAWIVAFSLVGSVGAVAGAALFLAFPERTQKALVPNLVGYAVGTLLAAAFLGLLPRALEQAPPASVMASALFGMVLFFVLEKLVLWRHCHLEECETHTAVAPLILVGDAFHNFVDGIVIAAAFLSSIPLGIATAIAVTVHEVPQEVGDFAILLHSGYPRRRALVWNTLSSLATLPGAILAYYSLTAASGAVPFVLAVSAASFIYIAAADLIPGLHRQEREASGAWQVLLMLAGIGTILLVRMLHRG